MIRMQWLLIGLLAWGSNNSWQEWNRCEVVFEETGRQFPPMRTQYRFESQPVHSIRFSSLLASVLAKKNRDMDKSIHYDWIQKKLRELQRIIDHYHRYWVNLTPSQSWELGIRLRDQRGPFEGHLAPMSFRNKDKDASTWRLQLEDTNQSLRNWRERYMHGTPLVEFQEEEVWSSATSVARLRLYPRIMEMYWPAIRAQATPATMIAVMNQV